jgi:hypothetical protein
MGKEEFETLHPSVRWVYSPGGQIGSLVLLLLPVSVDNYISRVELGEDCVLVTERGRTSEIAIAWLAPTYAISLEDGSPTFGRANEEIRFYAFTMDYDASGERHIGRLPNGLAIVLASGRRLLIGPGRQDEAAMVEVATLREGPYFSEWLDVGEAPGNFLVLGSTRHVICIDLSQLPAPAGGSGQQPD